MAFGFSFDPSADQQGQGDPQNPGGPRRAQTPVQNAIQLLSLRLPRVVGARSPVMPALLGGAGGVRPSGGTRPHVDAIVNSVLGKVLGPEAAGGGGAPSVPPMGAPSTQPSPSLPAPNMAPPAPLPPAPRFEAPRFDFTFGLPGPSVPPSAPTPGEFGGGGWSGGATPPPPPSGSKPPPTFIFDREPPTRQPGPPPPLPPPTQLPYREERGLPLPTPPPGKLPDERLPTLNPEPEPGTVGTERATPLPTPPGGKPPYTYVEPPKPPGMPPTPPTQSPDFASLIQQAVQKVGTQGDWNQYNNESFYNNDPFVKLFADTFGRSGNWNAFKPGG